MSLLSIEKTRKECFVLVGEVNCFCVIVRSQMSLHPSFQRTTSLTILGVSFTETLKITLPIDNIITRCYQTFHAFKIITAHGHFGPKIYDITESLIISPIKYAAPSWCGVANHEDIKQLQSLLNKLTTFNYLPPNYPKIKAIFSSLMNAFFQKLPVTRKMYSIRSSHLSSLHPVICGDERTITPKQFFYSLY